MRKKVVIILSIMVILFFIISIIGGASKYWKQEITAEQGVLDLTDYNVESNEMIVLNGEWQFYKGQFLDPASAVNTSNSGYIDVPASWDERYPSLKEDVEVGTYRLVIQLPEDGNYGIRVNMIRNASNVFINGVEANEQGKVSTESTEYQYRQGKYEAYGQSDNKEMEIMIHVANYQHPNGGIIKPIIFGNEEQIELLADRNKMMEGFVLSGFVLLAIIAFSNFIQQNKSRHELYFALSSLLLAVYIAAGGNEKLIYLLFPNLSNSNLLSIQLPSAILFTLFFLLFIYSLFRKYANLYIVKVLVILLILQVVYHAVPIRIFEVVPFITLESGLVYFVILISLPYLYFIFILFKAFRDRAEGIEYLMLVVTSLICYAIALSLDLLFGIHVDQLTIFSLFFMGLGFSFYISYRRRLIFEKLDRLSLDLLTQEQLKEESLFKTSKELDRPIDDIIQSSTILMKGESGPLKMQQQELVYDVKNNADKLAQLLENFRNAMGDKEQLTIKIEPLHLKVINEMVDDMSLHVNNSVEVVIENRLAMDSPLVMANENSLKQVILQLLENAIENTESGKIVVENKVINQMMHLSVEDTGKGIQEKYIPYVFDTFFQIPEAQKTTSSGMGLGLTITKNFVTLMHGEIWVESSSAKGTRITFTLPIAETNQEGEWLTQEKEMAKKGSEEVSLSEQTEKEAIDAKVILIADSDPDHFLHLSFILSQSGYRVIAAHKGADMDGFLKRESIHLAVIDIKMPDISSLALINTIRQEYNQVELPILLLSPFILKTDKSSLLQAGVNDFMRKPVAENELLPKIQSLFAVQDAVEQSITNELKAYHAQITPHFLFNTLNTIIALSYKDGDKSREALSYLSIYFRAKLNYQKQQSLVPLDDEIELVQAYLAIEKLRFGDRLTIHYNIDEQAQILIPSMTIQPLVENAIQHGLFAKPIDEPTFSLSIKEEEDVIVIRVEDNGVGIPKEKQEQLLRGESQRFGFKNPFAKLTLIKNATFELESEEGKGTRIWIRLKRNG
ncbi:ATP-binding protein [Gracilibacillus phocaeensis]|uniref:ATP-binding protein n=1 Tax=Gracilibacillus phocaeensis TaxID=2042304 RepID=UPI00103248C8|nr:ATP-binding protein [Gracilibacillus phocaeensis]